MSATASRFLIFLALLCGLAGGPLLATVFARPHKVIAARAKGQKVVRKSSHSAARGRRRLPGKTKRPGSRSLGRRSRSRRGRVPKEQVADPVETPALRLPPVEVHHDRKAHHAPEAKTPQAGPGTAVLVLPAMRGSRDILLRQNEIADSDGLRRVKDDRDLLAMRGERELVTLPVGAGLRVDERLPLDRRYCRPWAAKFLAALGRAHYARFHTALQVNSAVRTVEFQERLLRVNGNAAPATGDTASPHLTGQAIDVAKKGLSLTEVAWMRGYLMPLVQQGRIDVEEEFVQSCFHISVYRVHAGETGRSRPLTEPGRGAIGLAVAVP